MHKNMICRSSTSSMFGISARASWRSWLQKLTWRVWKTWLHGSRASQTTCGGVHHHAAETNEYCGRAHNFASIHFSFTFQVLIVCNCESKCLQTYAYSVFSICYWIQLQYRVVNSVNGITQLKFLSIQQYILVFGMWLHRLSVAL